MQFKKQRQHSTSPASGENVQEPASLVNRELEEAVSCCLADVDSALSGTVSTKKQAVAEYTCIADRYYQGELSYEGAEDAFRLFQARYAHLNLRVKWCCGSPSLYDGDGGYLA